MVNKAILQCSKVFHQKKERLLPPLPNQSKREQRKLYSQVIELTVFPGRSNQSFLKVLYKSDGYLS